MRKILFAGAAIAGLAACSPADEMRDDTGAAASDTSSAASADAAQPPQPPKPGQSGAVKYENNAEVGGGSREFSYAWPAQVTAIPTLAEQFKIQRDKDLAAQKASWAQSIADCPADSSACRNNSFALEWEVVADLPDYLSLSNTLYTYGGGAHGNYGRGALVWDPDKSAAIEPKAMFASEDSLDAAIGETACAMLNRERSKRRGEAIVQSDAWPNQCVSMDETVLMLGSSNGETFDRLGVYYGPYVAGAYAEGDFEFTVPVTRSVIDALKPEYRDAFTVK